MMRLHELSARVLVGAGILVWTFGLGCQDPPPPPGSGALILGIRTVLPGRPNPRLSGGARETLNGLTGLQAWVVRIDVVHRTVADDPLTEQVITVDDTLRTVELTGDLNQQVPGQLGFINIPAGFVFQIRLIVKAATLTLRGDTFHVTIPSGPQTGIKINPIDGVPFEIKAGERSGARIVLNPFKQLIRRRRQGFKMKPVVVAEHVAVQDLTPILFDRVDVRFKDGVPRTRIDEINAEIGATVIDFDARTNYFVMRLPASVSFTDALMFYVGKDETRVALPDTLIFFDDAPRVIPCDANFQNPGPFTDVKAPEAWAVTQGSRKALLADADVGFDLTNPDMLPNYYINQGELLGYLINQKDLIKNYNCNGYPGCDCDNNGTVVEAEVLKCFDTDNDGFLTFVDLNNSKNAGLIQDRDGDGVITPKDLVGGRSGPCTPGQDCVGVEDGMDNDGNGRVDDLVGWDFADNDNLPQNPGDGGCADAHGVGTAGLMAAVGAPPPVPPDMCASTLVAGMNWVGRLVPIKIGTAQLSAQRSGAFLAMSYAAGLGADVMNASWGITFARGTPVCEKGHLGGAGKKLDELVPLLNEEVADALGNMVLVTTAPNCVENLDSPDIFKWPAELDNPNIITVTSLKNEMDMLDGFSAFGPQAVDIAAPGDNHTLLNFGGGVNEMCGGTSFAAPLVAGTVGLIIANNANPPIQGNPAKVVSRVLCNARVASDLTDQVGGGGRVLDVFAAVTNGKGCP